MGGLSNEMILRAHGQQQVIDQILSEHNLTLNKLLTYPHETQQAFLEQLSDDNKQKLELAINSLELPQEAQ